MKKTKQKAHVFLAILLLSFTGLFAQSVKVSGVIRGADDKQPLPGVVIKIEGTDVGVTTDLDGKYKIDAPSSASKLVFSYVGMQTQTVNVGNGGEMNITMQIGVMKEVTVTALGITKETKALGYSVSKVSGEDIVESGEPNVIEALAAKAPGVEVTGSGGTPGASSKILIRGNNTLTGDNTPLIVVDGIPVDNSVNNIQAGDAQYNGNLAGVNESNRGIDINPEDIESVTILKGAAAAALYGSKASNGAILYTTKRGHKGKGIGVIYSTSIEFDKVDKLPALQTRWSQGDQGVYNTLVYDANNLPPIFNNSQSTTGTGSSWGPLASKAGPTGGSLPTYNNVGNFFQTGAVLNNNVAISGGDDNSALRLSIGNTHQTGVIPDTKLDRTSVRVTADHKVNDWFDMGGTVDYANTATEKAQNGSNLAGTMLTLLRTPNTFNAADDVLPNGYQRQFFYAYDNPYWAAANNPFTDETNRIMGNVFFNLKPAKGLKFTAKLGTDMYHTNSQQNYAISSMGDDLSDGLGQVNLTSTENRQLYGDLMVNYDTKLTEDIGMNLLGGYNYQYLEFSTLYARGRGLSIPDFYNLSNAATLAAFNSALYSNTNAGFADASFDYKHALYLSVTGRNEWSSTFGPNGPSFFYPSASLSWIFTESIKHPNWFSFGKLRGSFASVGKAITPYSLQTYYGPPSIADGWTNGLGFPYNGSLPGNAISSNLNTANLKPEVTNEYEFGTDLRFFEDRVNLDLTYYNRTTSDVLLFQPVSAASGFISQYVNAGVINNYGFEIALGLVPVKTKDFSWTLTGNWSKNISDVTKLANGVTQYSIESGFSGIGSYAIVGQPYGVFYGTAWQRDGNGNLLIGQNGLPNPTLTSQKLGNPNPDWLSGINNAFKYKAWTFSFLWDIRHGGQIWNGTAASLNYRGVSAASDARDGSNTNYTIAGVYAPGTIIGGQNVSGQANVTSVTAQTYFQQYLGGQTAQEGSIQDGGWVRLRSVGISYRIKTSTAEKQRWAQYVEIGASARNLLLFTKYTGVDPETSLTGAGSNINGFDYFNNPGTKSVAMNLKVGF